MVDISTLKDINEHQRILLVLQEFDSSTLERKDLGPANFSGALDPAEKIIALAKEIHIQNLKELPVTYQKAISTACTNAHSVFQNIINFNFSAHPHPTQVRDQYIKQINGAYESFFRETYPIISYISSKRSDLKEKEIAASNLIDKLKKQIEDMQTSIEEKLKEANSLIEGIKNASAKSGTLEQAIHFREEKKYHRKRSQWWSAATIISALILLLYTALSINLHDWLGVDLTGPNQETLGWQVQTTKILIFAVLAYLLVLSSRNFMSHKHNMIVNSHREVALHTFEALAKAANQDDGARDIILNHAAVCIFSPQETGYAKSSSSDAGANLGGASLIVNLAKQAVGKE